MIYSLEINTREQVQLHEKKILQEAIAHFDNMIIMRHWNAMYGGVFVQSKSGLKPNPYLKNNTLKDAQGNTLIKINPAWMTRQISELSNQKSQYYYKITSLKPINPKNTPDVFEKAALHYFEQHKDEKYYYRLESDHFNFMGALITEAECLACHQEAGYQLGDIRGGIRVSIPSNILQAEIHSLHQHNKYTRLFILLSASIILFIFYRFMNALYQHQQHIETLNTQLESKVKERTYSIERLYQHESYIKNLLKTVSEVNELLLTSMSIQNVLQNCADKLSQHKHYRFTWVGLLNQNHLEIAHKFNDNNNIIDKEIYVLGDTSNNEHISLALDAIMQQAPVVKICEDQHNHYSQRQDDSPLHWQLAIPLFSNEQKLPFGVINIYSDRQQGFESEEIDLLEQLSGDIGLTLYSYKQKAVLEQMELQRISNYEETILAFVNIIEQRDTYTAGHTIRVAEYCKKIATILKIDAQAIKKLQQAAILHDIGKVATPDAVLLKPGKLNTLEYDLIKQHAYAGFNMLSKIEMYKDLAEIIRYHHIRYDGNGYPPTKSPDDVPFLSHIMVVADAFDAMTTNRIYRPRLSIEAALLEIKHQSGRQFHPKVVDAALEALKNTQMIKSLQTPTTDLEQKRFSYFFCDVLTEVYNENYLQITLANTENKKNCFYLVLINNFSLYNKQHGWEKGNQLLIKLANELDQAFPDAMCFRYHGDDFVLLFDEHVELNINFLKNLDIIKHSPLEISLQHLELSSADYNIENIYDQLEYNSKLN